MGRGPGGASRMGSSPPHSRQCAAEMQGVVDLANI